MQVQQAVEFDMDVGIDFLVGASTSLHIWILKVLMTR